MKTKKDKPGGKVPTAVAKAGPSAKKVAGTSKKRAKPPAARRGGEASTPAGLVVGVGSSAGGLQALKLLMSGLDPASNACFVMAQHVAPAHQSLLAELLAPKTSLSVSYLESETIPRGNQILVIPPGNDAIARDGKLVPLEADSRRPPGAHPSIDRLFQSLALEFGDRAVGVVLSGSGSDGAVGAAAIKAAGGIVLVQDPKTAQFDSMPMAVIQARCYDAILLPDQIGVALVRIARAQGTGLDAEAILQSMPEKVLQQIKTLVRRRTGFNLNHYKSSTVLRRIQRRALLASTGSLEEYLTFLSADADEAKRLAGDLSVRVTSFFRDPPLFSAFATAIEGLVERHQHGDVIRIWVPGCASGEEAYSLAMLLMESFRAAEKAPSFLMFITDINPESLAMARLGRYALDDLKNLPDGFLERYFEIRDEFAEIAKPLRQNLVFASQNVVEDPPFSKLDLVSCRNLLIYFEAEAQDHVIAAFHYALKPGGTLFLGSSENIDSQKALFEPVNLKARIYQRTAHPVVFHYKAPNKPSVPVAAGAREVSAEKAVELVESNGRGLSRKDAITRSRDLVAEHYSPPAILVNEDDVILHFVGDLSPFVTLPRGQTSWLAHQLVLPPLNLELRTLLIRCRKERVSIRGGSYSIEVRGQTRRVTMVAHPDLQGSKLMVFVAFEWRTVSDSSDELTGGSANLIRELEGELANTREHLQSLIEEVENNNEELQTVNEELQSSNEELQSSNEEMHTSNEELQSANEELLTVNDELAGKTAELELARNDLSNLKEALEIGIVAVDGSLKITLFNAAFAKLLGDTQLRSNTSLVTLDWPIPSVDIAADALEVIRTRTRTQRSRLISVDPERHLRLGIVPFGRDANDELSGAVLSFTDVSELIVLQGKHREQEMLFRLMLESSVTGTLLTDVDGLILEANPAATSQSGHPHDQLLGSRVESLIAEDSVAELRSHLRLAFGQPDSKSSIDLQLRGDLSQQKWVALSISTVRDGMGQPYRLVVQLHDIHQRKRSQEKLVAEHQRLQFLNAATRRVMESESQEQLRASLMADLSLMFDGMSVSYLRYATDQGLQLQDNMSPAGEWTSHRIPLRVAVTAPYLKRLRSLQISSPGERAPGEDIQADFKTLDLPISDGDSLVGVLRLEASAPRRWPVDDLSLLRAVADNLSLAERSGVAQSQREQAFKSLRQERDRVEITLNSIRDGVITTNPEGLIETMNPVAQQLCGVDGDSCRGRALFSVYQVMKGEKSETQQSIVEQCLKRREPVEDSSLDLYLLPTRGTRIAVNHSAAPIIDEEGDLLGAVLVFRDVTDTRLLARELSHRASHDPLTGLPNRAEMDRQLESAIKEAQGGDARHALIAFDLDHFKPVNDTAGHAAGDALLRLVAKTCRDKLRAVDVLARTGGDEFIVLLRNCGEERAKQIAEALVAAIAELRFQWEAREYRIGASAGITLITANAPSMAALLDRADAACYVAKRGGRGRVEFSNADAAQAVIHSDALALVRMAISEEQCAFQQQKAVAINGALGGYVELLMRLGSESGGGVSPDDFVTTARRHQLLVPLDRMAIRKAMQFIAGQNRPDGTIYGINLFEESIRDSKLPEALLEAAHQFGVAPACVAIEIPEVSLARNSELLTGFCKSLRNAGFRLAMDQFGSNLLSFAAIRALQLDFVKINLRPQSLSLGRPEPVETDILEALCHICRRNGTRTIAVGVESVSTLDELRVVGVDFVQGTALAEGVSGR